MLRTLVVFGALGALSGCAKLTLAWADLKPDGDPATPSVFFSSGTAGEPASIDDWDNSYAPRIRAALEREVFGSMPDSAKTEVLAHKTIDASAFNGAGQLEEYQLSLTATFNGVSVETRGAGEQQIYMNLVTPTAAQGPVPVILMETFCRRWNTLPHSGVAGAPEEIKISGGIETYVFGRYICTPPVEEILRAGYAIATIFPSEFVPDNKERGLAELRRLSQGHEDDATRWGAVGAWAWAYSRMVDVLETDARFDQDAIITWGHSRYGKSAIVAAAYDDRIDGVIAHQSGTGGASLNRNKKGESVRAITNGYPHWFNRNYAGYAGREGEMSIDQHHLLALVAPRPILLGNARRDVWSDPNGAFRAAIGADPAWEFAGSAGLEQSQLDEWRPQADIAFWIRPGTHGVVKEDWPAFLAFLDAHFK